MSSKKVQPLIDDLLSGLCILCCGLTAPFISDEWNRFSFPLIAFILAAWMFLSWRRERLSEEEKRDVKRGESDERNLMVREKAAWLSSQLEYWLLIALFFIFGIVLDRYDIAFVFYWILIVRWFLFLAARWWMNRKY